MLTLGHVSNCGAMLWMSGLHWYSPACHYSIRQYSDFFVTIQYVNISLPPYRTKEGKDTRIRLTCKTSLINHKRAYFPPNRLDKTLSNKLLMELLLWLPFTPRRVIRTLVGTTQSPTYLSLNSFTQTSSSSCTCNFCLLEP